MAKPKMDERRQHHIAEAEALVAEIDQWRIGNLALPDDMTVEQQLRLAELHIQLATLNVPGGDSDESTH